MRLVALGFAAAIMLLASISAADEILPSGHVAFAMGGATRDPSFRLGLDASLGVAFGEDDSGGWTLAPSIVTGFGKYPTYFSLDLGRIFHADAGNHTGGEGLAGIIGTIGPAVRMDKGSGAGGEISLRAYLFVLQAGVRAIVIGTNGSEAQIEGTLGFGFL